MATGQVGLVVDESEAGRTALERENARLESRVDELKAALAETERALATADEWVDWATAEVAAAERRVAELEAALEAERARGPLATLAGRVRSALTPV